MPDHTPSMPGRSVPQRVLASTAITISWILGSALIGAVGLSFVNIVSRYVFDSPLNEFDEIEIYMMVAIAFLGAVVAQIRHTHLRMDVLAKAFPPSFAPIIHLAESLTAITISGIIAWVSWGYIAQIYGLGTESENTHIKMWIPYSLVAVSFTLILCTALIRLFFHAPADETTFDEDENELSVANNDHGATK